LSVNKNSPSTRLGVKVTPNAGRNEISGLKDGVLQVKINAPPEKGKANKELVAFIAEKAGISKTAISIIKGMTSRNKVILIQGISNEELISRLQRRGKREGG
jgi:uncharacterized protein (TIGR00251 family)